MKKKLSLFLAALLLITSVGCGSDKKDNTEPAASSGQTESAASQPTESASQPPTESSSSEANTIEQTPLKEFFASHNMKVGTCVTNEQVSKPKSKQMVLKHFNSITMENSMKPDSTLNKTESIKKGTLCPMLNSETLNVLKFAKQNNMGVRGHTFVWYSQTPNWIFYEDFDESKSLVSREVMLERMESYIKGMFELIEEKGYSDVFYAYDVANEAWMEDGKMRDCLWKQVIGDDYLWYAFYYAKKYAPEHVDLYYNDYNEQFKANTYLKFIKTLVDENGNYLIDGIGLQAHMYTQDDLTQYLSAVDTIASLGLKVQLTELDICLGAYQHTLPANDANLKKQGMYYYNLLNALLERVDSGKLKMDAITFWGYNDDYSWRKEGSPLLFDKNFRPKYSYYGVLQEKEKAGF